MDHCETQPKEKTIVKPGGENVAMQPEFIQLYADQSVIREKELKLNVKAGCAQIGDNNKAVVNGTETLNPKLTATTISKNILQLCSRPPAHVNKKPFLQLMKVPDLPIRVGRRMSRKGFPDKNDHEFTLSVYKNSASGLKEKLDIDFCNNKKKGKRYVMTPNVKLCGQSRETEANYQVIQRKSDANRIGEAVFVFRFHNRQAKLLIKFRLEALPAQGSSKSKREFLDETTIEVETVSGKTRRCNKTNRGTQSDYSDHYTASGSEICETEPEVAKTVVLFSMQNPSSSETSDNLKTISYRIMKDLHHPRDNGCWGKFYSTADELAAKFLDPDSQIAVQLERSVAATYRDELDGSAKMIQEILHILEDPLSAVNVSLLAGRAYCYLSGVYRRQKKLGAAQDCVDLAEQCLHNTGTNMDKSFLAYEQGSIDLELTAHESNLNPQQVVRAKGFLQKCIDICIRLEEQDDTLYIKKHHFAFIKIPMLLLDCRSTAGRQRFINADSIQEAKAGLDTLEERYWDDITRGERIQFYLGRADQFYRDESYTRSKEFAQKALEMASTLTFNTEIEPARARLQAIEAKLSKEPSVDACALELSDFTLGSSSSVTAASPAEQD